MKRLLLILIGAIFVGGCHCANATKDVKAKEEANKQTVLAFYDTVLNKKDFEAAKQYFGSYYRQHNPMAADGPEGLHGFVDYIKKTMPDAHWEFKRVWADGDFVILHVHMTKQPGDRGSAIVDIFRLENGKVVEHWDVIQDIPEKTASGNPMF